MTDINKKLDDLEERVKKLEEKTSISLYSNTDVLLDQAREIITHHSEVSASLLQRRLTIGYARASRILDLFQQEGIVSEGEGSKPRKVLTAK